MTGHDQLATRSPAGDGTAERYARGRPSYPAAAVDHLVRQLDVGRGDVLLDLGAGTGKMTRKLLSSSSGVVTAVEPSGEMCALLAHETPAARIVRGLAGALPMAASSIGAVVAANSFHWFANTAAIDEIARVLVPRGGLGLVWNQRDVTQPVQAELETILSQHRSTPTNYREVQWRGLLRDSGCFDPVSSATFEHHHVVDGDQLVDLVLSVSYVAGLDQGQKREVAARVRAVFDQHGTAQIALRYRTHVHTTWLARPVS